METITVNLSGKTRREARNGRAYLVAPMTLLRPQVLSGSQGALLYDADEISRSAHLWADVPIVVNHPTENGKPISGRSPSILDRVKVGRVYNPSAVDGVLTAEGWFDVEATRRVDARLLANLERGEPSGLSTGLFVEKDAAPAGSVHNGTPYTHTTRGYLPDHLAALTPEITPACAPAQGCGILVNEGGKPIEEKPTETPPAANADEKKSAWQRLWTSRPWEFIGRLFSMKDADAKEVLANVKVSHDDLRTQLCSLVAERFGPGEYSLTDDRPYVVDVFDKYLIYTANGKMWKIGYATDLRTGTVSLADGEPQEVTRTIDYKPVSNQQADPPTPIPTTDGGTTTVDRTATILWLTANCECWKAAGAAEDLGKLTDASLTALKATAEATKAAQVAANAAQKPFEHGDTIFTLNASTGQWEGKPKAPPPPPAATPPIAKPLTEAEWLQSAPAPVRNRLRYLEDMENRERGDLIGRLTANASDDASKAQAVAIYSSLPLEQLRPLAAAVPAPRQAEPTPYYWGAAPVANRAPDFKDDEDLEMVPPVVNWAEEAKLKRA